MEHHNLIHQPALHRRLFCSIQKSAKKIEYRRNGGHKDGKTVKVKGKRILEYVSSPWIMRNSISQYRIRHRSKNGLNISKLNFTVSRMVQGLTFSYIKVFLLFSYCPSSYREIRNRKNFLSLSLPLHFFCFSNALSYIHHSLLWQFPHVLYFSSWSLHRPNVRSAFFRRSSTFRRIWDFI